MDIYRIVESLDKIEEKWKGDAEIDATGEYADKTVAELRKMYNALKKSGPHKAGSEPNTKMKQIAFAIRAKTGFGKVGESEAVSENKESGVKVTNIEWKAEPGVDLPSSVKLNISAPIGTDNDKIWELVGDKLEDTYGYTVVDYDMQFEESVEEAMEDDYNGASVEDIASAITQRMMKAKNFGALVREVDILDLNDAIESVAEFHEGGDLGTSDVSNMVRDVLKQLGKDDMKLEDVEVKEEELSEMMGYYTIYKDGKVVATGVRAMSKEDAINQAYMKMGSASKYTGAGRGSFDAVREEVEVEEGNDFTKARLDAIKAGKDSFEVDGKTYKVTGDTSDEEKMTEDYDKDEYDEEGEMADNQLDVVHDAAQELQDIIDSDDNLPEWVQSKITKAMDYLDTARDYMKSVEDDEEDADDVEPPKDEGDEEVEETTVAGAVATSADGAGVYKNASVYEGYNNRVDNMITEGMNVTVTASDEGEPSVSVNATGEDAMALAQLLQLAAVPQQPQAMTKKVCKNCGDEQGKPEHMDCPYDCMDPMGENFMEVACEADEANSADNGVTYDMHYLINSISGGLNGPKRQINPNNPGDNPMAMTGIGKDTLNMSQQVSEGEDVKSHLETLYKEFKSK